MQIRMKGNKVRMKVSVIDSRFETMMLGVRKSHCMERKPINAHISNSRYPSIRYLSGIVQNRDPSK